MIEFSWPVFFTMKHVSLLILVLVLSLLYMLIFWLKIVFIFLSDFDWFSHTFSFPICANVSVVDVSLYI